MMLIFNPNFKLVKLNQSSLVSFIFRREFTLFLGVALALFYLFVILFHLHLSVVIDHIWDLDILPFLTVKSKSGCFLTTPIFWDNAVKVILILVMQAYHHRALD